MIKSRTTKYPKEILIQFCLSEILIPPLTLKQEDRRKGQS